LNGDGCAALGDIPILPTVGAVTGDPGATTAAFTHASERATPGSYGVTLGSRIKVNLAVTTRTGLADITFPSTANANLLFKVAGSAVVPDESHAEIVGDREIAGWVKSGYICDTQGSYVLSFDVKFDRPFTSTGAWNNKVLQAGSRVSNGPSSGTMVTFDASKNHTVGMKVGISFVSVANARANLDAENQGWNVGAVARGATATWNSMLRRIDVGGGRAVDQATFYSSLYRSLLHPNVFSDVNKQYAGFDGKTHVAATTQYTNFSGWDIYRSELPLLAMIAPQETSVMMQSLLNDGAQLGHLPKWPFTNSDSGEMNGDAVDPILASAYAFGATNFDATAAVTAMVKGATTVGSTTSVGVGWDVERQDLDEYLKQGWIQSDRRDKESFDYTVGGSETLEYAIDDYAISRLATAVGDSATAATFLQRAANWKHLFNPATGYLSARNAAGAFPTGPAFQPSRFPGVGQDGWEEGNSIQYTWSVPQDLRGLFDAMGGNAAAVKKLDDFFTELNTSRFVPKDWAGNEPALGIPWQYDYAGAPWKTQDVVRRIATQLYSATPNGMPGNDDLGSMASFYVWAAIGLFPETPGRADLALGSPLFPRVVVQLAGGRTISMDAPAASVANRYVQHLVVTGVKASAACTAGGNGYECPWLPAGVLTTGAHLEFTLAATPNTTWGSAPAAAPPSITTQ
jgi:predicted alpha-1,2-mannosidase